MIDRRQFLQVTAAVAAIRIGVGAWAVVGGVVVAAAASRGRGGEEV